MASASSGRAHERRREQRVERQLVERVGERRQVGAQVAHLLLAPVAARRPPRRWAGRGRRSRARRATCPCWPAAGPPRRPGSTARSGPASSAIRWARSRASDGAPGRASCPAASKGELALQRPAVAVHHEQLHARRHARRLARARVGLPQRLEPSSNASLEGEVEHVQQLAAAAEVVRDARLVPGSRPPRLAPSPEDADVGVAEAVDRLVRVADREQVVPLEQLEDRALQPVRVLELVDHHVLEALAVVLAQAGLVDQQVAREQLEVLEVEPRARAPSARVALVEESEQLAQQRVVAQLALPRRRPRGRRRAPRRGARSTGVFSAPAAPGLSWQLLELLRLAEPPGAERPARRGSAPSWRARARRSRRSHPWRPAPPGRPAAPPRARAPRRRPTPAPGAARAARVALAPAAQPRVHRAHHLLELLRGVGGEQLEPRPALLGAQLEEGLERALERVDAAGAPPRARRARGTPGRCPRPAGACAAGGSRSRGSWRSRRLRRARVLALAELQEAAADAQLQLGGGLLGERDREDAVHRHVVVHHRAHEALDQHARSCPLPALACRNSEPSRRSTACCCSWREARTLHPLVPADRRVLRSRRSTSAGLGAAAAPRPRACGRTSSQTVSPRPLELLARAPRGRESRCRRSPSRARPAARRTSSPRGRRSCPASGTYTPPAGRSPISSRTASM